MQRSQERIIKKVHAVSSKFECNAMTSKIVSKVIVSGGILKSGTINRECNAGKKI